MSVLTRMSRVLTFRHPSAQFVKLQYNLNDHHFSMFHQNRLTNYWLFESPTGETPTLEQLEHHALHALGLEGQAQEYDRRADDPDFTDLFPSY